MVSKLLSFLKDNFSKRSSRCMTSFRKLPHRIYSLENKTMISPFKLRQLMKSLLILIKTVWLQVSVPGRTEKFVAKLSKTIINTKLIFSNPILIHLIPKKLSLILHKIKLHIKKNQTITSI